MSNEPLLALVKRVLFQVAPELEGESIDPGEPLRDQFELDSMDFLNFVIGLNQATGIPISEEDYQRLTTLEDCVAFLRKKGETAGTS